MPVRETHKQAKYILDAKHEGNVARFINHSCDPNLYVQPVLSHHHDISQTQVCLFAGHNIAPMTELTYASSSSSPSAVLVPLLLLIVVLLLLVVVLLYIVVRLLGKTLLP